MSNISKFRTGPGFFNSNVFGSSFPTIIIFLFSHVNVCQIIFAIFCCELKIFYMCSSLIGYCCTEHLSDTADNVHRSDSSNDKDMQTTVTSVDDSQFGPAMPPLTTSLGTVDHTEILHLIIM